MRRKREANWKKDTAKVEGGGRVEGGKHGFLVMRLQPVVGVLWVRHGSGMALVLAARPSVPCAAQDVVSRGFVIGVLGSPRASAAVKKVTNSFVQPREKYTGIDLPHRVRDNHLTQQMSMATVTAPPCTVPAMVSLQTRQGALAVPAIGVRSCARAGHHCVAYTCVG